MIKKLLFWTILSFGVISDTDWIKKNVSDTITDLFLNEFVIWEANAWNRQDNYNKYYNDNYCNFYPYTNYCYNKNIKIVPEDVEKELTELTRIYKKVPNYLKDKVLSQLWDIEKKINFKDKKKDENIKMIINCLKRNIQENKDFDINIVKEKITNDRQNKKIEEEITNWDYSNINLLSKISMDTIIKLNKYKGNTINLNWLKKINDLQVYYLKNLKKDLLLNWLTKITKDQAYYFSMKFEWWLHLDWLTNITDKQLVYLVNFWGTYLSLNWLKKISDNQAIHLSNFNWALLALDWLTKITVSQAKILSSFRWDSLSLNWLETITDKKAAHLSQLNDVYLSLNWLTKISDNQTKQLFKIWHISLSLKWVKNMSKSQIDSFYNSKLELRYLVLWIKHLSDKQFEYLKRFNSRFLVLPNLKLTEKQFMRLAFNTQKFLVVSKEYRSKIKKYRYNSYR